MLKLLAIATFIFVSYYNADYTSICDNIEYQQEDFFQFGFEQRKNLRAMRKSNMCSIKSSGYSGPDYCFITVSNGSRTYKNIVYFYSLKNFPEDKIHSFDKIENEDYQGLLRYCQYDTNFVYVYKNTFSYESLGCRKLNELQPYQDSPPRTTSDRFNLRDQFNRGIYMASGSFGAVNKCIGLSFEGKFYIGAIKKIVKVQDGEYFTPVEIYVLQSFQHTKHSPKFFGCAYDNNHVYYAQEMMGGTLESPEFKTLYKTLSTDQKYQFFINMAQALQAFHKTGFSHNDLKPGNMMIDRDFNVKLIDFGAVGPLNGLGIGQYTLKFTHPKRFSSNAFPIYDFYSLALSIIDIDTEGRGLNKIFSNAVSQGHLIKNYKDFRERLEYNNMISAIKNLMRDWGTAQNFVHECAPKSRDYSARMCSCNNNCPLINKMNLVDMLLKVICFDDHEFDLDNFISRLQTLRTNYMKETRRALQIL